MQSYYLSQHSASCKAGCFTYSRKHQARAVLTASGKTGSKQFPGTKTVTWKGTVEQFIPQIYKRALGGEGGKMLAFIKQLPLKMKFIFYFKKIMAFQAEGCDIWPHTFSCTNKHINLNGTVDLLFLY